MTSDLKAPRSTSLNTRLTQAAQCLLIASPALLVLGRSPVEIAMMAIGLLFIIVSIRTGKVAWLKESWVKVAIALWVYMWVRNLFVEPDFTKSFISGLVWVRYPLFAAALAYWLLIDNRTQRLLVYSLTATLAFLIIDGLYQYITHTDILGKEVISYPHHVRLTGPFSYPRLGIMMAWLFLPVIGYWFTQRNSASQKSYRFAILFCAATVTLIFISGDRMAFILSWFGLGIYWLTVKSVRNILLFCAITSAMLIITVSLYDTSLAERQLGQTTEEVGQFSKGSYGQSFAEGWQLTTLHPFFGIGGKQYQTACLRDIKPANPNAFCGLHPHNFYLDWLAEYGFVGMAGMLALIIIWFKKVATQWHVTRRNLLAGALFATLVMRFWPLAAVTSQFTLWSAYPQFLMIGWLMAVLYQQAESHSSQEKR